MRARWEALHAALDRSVRSLQAEQAFQQARQHPALARFDQPFPAHAEAALRAWHANNPADKFGTHDYERDDFGVSRAMVHERFADYIARFPRSIEKRSKP